MWTERLRVSCATGLINPRFEGDYFFNRASVHDCPDSSAASQIANMFWRRGMDCYLHDRDGRLESHGFTQIDMMQVLRATSTGFAGKTKVKRIERRLLPVWIDVFCESFAVPEWKREVGRIMKASFGRLELLLAFDGDTPAGCAALYTKNGVTGLYCLGTVSQLRGRGVANDILKTVSSGDLFVQTLGSGRLLPLFQKAGFVVVYTKKIYALVRPNELKGSKYRSVK